MTPSLRGGPKGQATVFIKVIYLLWCLLCNIKFFKMQARLQGSNLFFICRHQNALLAKRSHWLASAHLNYVQG